MVTILVRLEKEFGTSEEVECRYRVVRVEKESSKGWMERGGRVGNANVGGYVGEKVEDGWREGKKGEYCGCGSYGGERERVDYVDRGGKGVKRVK